MNINPLDNKTKEQDIVLSKWVDTGCKGTYLGVTAAGKSRLGIIAAGNDIRSNCRMNMNWLITTPTENLRDNEWENEFKKWGYEEERANWVTIECIQSAWKRKDQHWRGLIIDEVHSSLGPQYRKLLENNTFDLILCLTATLDDEEKIEFLSKYAPIFYSTSIERARNLDIVSDFKLYNLSVQPSKEEIEEYIKADNKYNKYITTFDDGTPGGAFRIAKMCLNINFAKNWASKIKGDYWIVHQHAQQVFEAIRERKHICYNAEGKLDAVKKISEKFPSHKTIIFSESIDFAERVKNGLGDKCVLFHSKMPNKARKSSLDEFSLPKGSITTISTVKALNAGFNVPSCNLGIITSGSSKSLDLFQRLGRTLRWEEGKRAIFIQLYLNLECKDIISQDRKWTKRRSKEVKNVEWINNIDQIIE